MSKQKKRRTRQKPKPVQPKAVVQPNLICLADVEEQTISWLWEPYVPLGKLTILEGDPETGKSYLSLATAAHVTNGRAMPFDKSSNTKLPRNVLMLVGEDGAADTIKPRFRKAGGDMVRLKLLDGIVKVQEGVDNVYSSITLDNIPMLEAALKEVRPALVTIDPFQCFLGQSVDMYRANETRPILSALSKLAEKYDCALVLIRHLKKMGDKTIYRGIGAIDILAAARSVLLAGRNPQPATVEEVLRVDPATGKILETKDRFALVHTKNNLGKRGSSLLYGIDDTGLSLDGISEITAEDLLNFEMKSVKQDVDEWLEGMLASGPKDANEIKNAAAAKGYGRVKLDSAATRLGVIRKPFGFGGAWNWRLPSSEENLAATQPEGETDSLPIVETQQAAPGQP